MPEPRPEAAAVRLGEAARDREPEPRAVPGSPAAERLKQRLPLLVGEAGAGVDDVDAELGRTAFDSEEHVRAGRGVAERVLEQVGEHPLDLGGVHLHRRRLGAEVEPDAGGLRAETGESLSDELVHVPQLPMGLGRAGLEPREVEQLLDDAIEARRLAADRLREAEPIVGFEREPRAGQRVGRGENRGQRRAQVVGHRAQKRRLEGVAAAQRLRLESLSGQALPLLGQLAQGGESRLGLLGAAARPAGELAHDDGRDDEDEEGEPVPVVLDRERVERRDEQEVEGDHAADRDGDGEDASPGDRDRDDREEVEHRQAEHRHVPLQELDRARHERERAGRCRDPGERSHPGNGTPLLAVDRDDDRDD
jgi:hypothetical protein